MRFSRAILTLAAAGVLGVVAADTLARDNDRPVRLPPFNQHVYHNVPVQLGPRPFYLLDELEDGDLKEELQSCADRTNRYRSSLFSIGHRGAPLQFPEHTVESYVAAARTGAGILECDVSFTNDGHLVCRHSECDLHTTTNILATDLAAKCSEPFTPYDPATETAASAKCCTSDLDVEEFLSLEGKMDSSNPLATTVDEYMGGVADFRTELYETGGTLLTHAQSIELFKELGTGFTPELKAANADNLAGTPLGDQEGYAARLIQEYIEAGVDPNRVWAQSFNEEDVYFWIDNYPEYGAQAVYLDDSYNEPNFDANDPSTLAVPLHTLKANGVQIVAPPMWMLLTTDNDDNIVPSVYAEEAQRLGLKMITWTLERSGRLTPGGGGWYYQTTANAIENDGDILRTVDVLAQDVGIIGLFSDWPATTTFYANCFDTNDGRRFRRR